MGDVIRIKKGNQDNHPKLEIQKGKVEDYHLVLRHFQGLMIDKYHQDFRKQTK
ncbi:hypothetical protein [Bacillus sp. AK128]